jgi:hypothetical protein
MRAVSSLLLITIVAVANAATSSPEKPMQAKGDCDFAAITPGTQASTPCSPTIGEDFRGIAIRAPAEVTFGPSTEDPLFGGFTKLIVSGAIKLPYPALGLRGEYNKFVLLVAVDSRAKEVFAGGLAPFGSPARDVDLLEGTDLTPADFAGVVTGSFFNPNIARDLNLPEREAEYDVYAVLGPYRSNVVHVKVRKQR